MSGERAWKAIDRLKNGEKWTQGTLYYAGSRCLLGALGNCRDSEDMGITEDRVARRLPLEVKAASMIIDEQFPDRVHNRVSGLVRSLRLMIILKPLTMTFVSF